MAQPLTSTEFEIPQRSGEVLCFPPARSFLAAARANARLLAESRLVIDGVPLDELRRRLRRSVWEAASAYTRSLGIAVETPAPPDAPLLVTGHQPLLFHPGIWSKHLLVDRLAAGAFALSVPVDSDVAEEIGVDVPHVDGSPRIVRETLVQAAPDVPYEAQAAPAPQVWKQFLDRVEAHLRTLPSPEIPEVFRGFARTAAGIESAADIGAFITTARRRHEGPRRYLELPVSHLSHQPEFRRFFLHLLRNCRRFAESYNRHLDAYRARYNVRTTAQPFPNLQVEGSRTELAFWILREGRRYPLFAERTRAGWRLWAGETPVATVRAEAGEEGIRDLEIRPRALTLTAFSRLCLADFFVHGVGGGRYDRVTDAVIADYFGITPPQYAVVTATLHLPLAEFDPAAERQSLRRRMLDLRHNPERLLSTPSPAEQELIAEKWRLIAALDGGNLTRRERRQATQRIREVNDRLSRVLQEEQAAIERRLEDLREVSEATPASTHRGYPFCFFPPEAVERLVETMVAQDGA